MGEEGENMDPFIEKLAQLMQARQELGEPPYVLLLGSSLSLTLPVRRAFARTEDWETFWKEMQRASPTERKALLKKPLDALGLERGYQAMARLAEAGYFNLILTLNVDDAIDDAVRPLPADQSVLLVHDGSNSAQIVETLSRATPRLKVVKLRGDINAQALPLTTAGQFEFPDDLEQTISEWLKFDTILVGDIPYDDDVQRCVKRSTGALWCILPDEPASDSFVMHLKRVRSSGEIITGADAEFNAFFTTLAERLEFKGSVRDLCPPEVEDIPPSVRPAPLDDDRVEVMLEVRAQMSHLLTFAEREMLPYPHPTDKRNEEAKYFFNERSERLASRLGELSLLVSPDVARQGDNVYEMFNTLWRMGERKDSRETREVYLVEIREAIDWFTRVTRQELDTVSQAISKDYKARLGRQLRGKMESLLALAEREVLPYPHQEEKRNRDAEWYFKEKTEEISAGLGAMTLFAAVETLEQGNEALRQFDALWTMAMQGEPAEKRTRQQERIERAVERFDLLLKRELA
jgi:hypothetical protein